jgi:hypothetical protein
MDEKKEVDREYPKSLHKDGARDGDHRIVNDKDEEDEAREQGYKTLHEVESAKPAKKGKK